MEPTGCWEGKPQESQGLGLLDHYLHLQRHGLLEMEEATIAYMRQLSVLGRHRVGWWYVAECLCRDGLDATPPVSIQAEERILSQVSFRGVVFPSASIWHPVGEGSVETMLHRSCCLQAGKGQHPSRKLGGVPSAGRGPGQTAHSLELPGEAA